MKTVDARGLSCPQPVLLTREAFSEVKEGTIEVLVDESVARDNVCRCARNFGWSPKVEDQNGFFRIVLEREGGAS